MRWLASRPQQSAAATITLVFTLSSAHRMKSSLSLTSALSGIPWLDDILSQTESTAKRKVLGHARPQIEKNLTYTPLRDEIAASVLKNKRIYSAIELSKNESTASAFFRCFPKIDLITLDLIYVPKAHRGHGVGHSLLSDMAKVHKDQHSVHLILDYANRKAFENSAGESLRERLLKVPTLRNLKKIGFTKLTHLGTMTIPGDRNIYPEVVLTRGDACNHNSIIASLD